MQRRIVGFHQDPELHWVAELECGHGQHIRHDPPWQLRPWVIEEAGRRERLGSPLDCLLCDSSGAPVAASPAVDPYTDARLQGLCDEGAAEAARRPAGKPAGPGSGSDPSRAAD